MKASIMNLTEIRFKKEREYMRKVALKRRYTA